MFNSYEFIAIQAFTNYRLNTTVWHTVKLLDCESQNNFYVKKSHLRMVCKNLALFSRKYAINNLNNFHKRFAYARCRIFL